MAETVPNIGPCPGGVLVGAKQLQCPGFTHILVFHSLIPSLRWPLQSHTCLDIAQSNTHKATETGLRYSILPQQSEVHAVSTTFNRRCGTHTYGPSQPNEK